MEKTEYMITATIRRLFMVVMIAALLAGCGGAPAVPTGGATAGQTPAADTGAAATTEAAVATEAAGEGVTEAPAIVTELTVYSGRNEGLIGKLIEQFETETGIDVNVRYGDTAELAATILEEGDNSPADVFFAQDAGALGALSAENRLQPLPDTILSRVDAPFRSSKGDWVGTSGRARVVVYNTNTLTETDLPDSIFGFTDPQWKGRIGWAPTNASFQAFVTALRVLEGEDRAREWLQGILANEPKVYEGNAPIVTAVGAGEIDVGFVNQYYLPRLQKEAGGTLPAANYFFKQRDPGSLVNVAGAAILQGTENQAAAEQFIAFLLGDTSQQYFSSETFEYPLVRGISPDQQLPPLESIQTPEIDLSKLEDLQGTLRLLQDLGIL